MRSSFLPAALLTLAGCAAQPAPPAATAVAKPNLVCEREFRVGSSIPVVTCAEPRTEAERQQMLDDMRNQMRGAPNVGKGGG